MDQIFGVYKPIGITSHDVVDLLRKKFREQKIGHAGTLDPLACGVLVIGIGKSSTKKLASVVAKEKEYIATVRLGVTSTTDDEEGEKTINLNPPAGGQIPNPERIQDALREFIGEIMQVPPVYSAVKVKGKEAYKRARKGESVQLAPRRVLVKDIEILKYRWPLLTLRIVTGPGVYIRALARDLGATLGCGAYLSALERTRVGEFTKEHAKNLDSLLKS
jgi:tRNA pseudouridine55 synthase